MNILIPTILANSLNPIFEFFFFQSELSHPVPTKKALSIIVTAVTSSVYPWELKKVLNNLFFIFVCVKSQLHKI